MCIWYDRVILLPYSLKQTYNNHAAERDQNDIEPWKNPGAAILFGQAAS